MSKVPDSGTETPATVSVLNLSRMYCLTFRLQYAASTYDPHAEAEEAEDEEEFDDRFYRMMVLEAADDLDKLRKTKDFNPSIIPFVTHILKSGTKAYSKREKMQFMTSVRAAERAKEMGQLA